MNISQQEKNSYRELSTRHRDLPCEVVVALLDALDALEVRIAELQKLNAKLLSDLDEAFTFRAHIPTENLVAPDAKVTELLSRPLRPHAMKASDS